VRGMQELVSPLGDQLTDVFDGPLLELTHVIFLTRRSSILKAVSVVHKCSSSCKFVKKEIPRNIERQNIRSNRT